MVINKQKQGHEASALWDSWLSLMSSSDTSLLLLSEVYKIGIGGLVIVLVSFRGTKHPVSPKIC